jgi:hypothetical protein
MIGKLIGKFLGFTLLAGVVGVLVIAGYFWYKSGQPMQVEKAQRIAPGITFREFWGSRVKQWTYWDEELKAVGQKGPCLNTGYIMFTFRLISSGPFVADLRAHQHDAKYTHAVIDANNGAVPSNELLYESNFFDAWWATVEEANWWAIAHDSGFPVKELNQRRACSTTYPVPTPNGG